jgi:pyocin large subunit-like protein
MGERNMSHLKHNSVQNLNNNQVKANYAAFTELPASRSPSDLNALVPVLPGTLHQPLFSLAA